MRDFHLPGRSVTIAQNGMAATSHPLAAAAAIDILKAGGNAMDAAIAGAVLLGICEPQMTGIGGDLFALWSRAGSNDIKALNGSGRAPQGIDAGAMRARGWDIPVPGSADSVTLPGAVDAFCRLSDNEGRLGLDRVLAPAIHYADEGVPVAPRVAHDWADGTANLQGDARAAFLINGKAARPGDIFRSPGNAEVLRRIASGGRDAFYTGEVADDMLAVLGAAGGVHTAEDFANTRSEETEAISGTYGSAEIFEHAPNGQGATALLILNMLKSFDIAGMDPFGAPRAHVEAEAVKAAYGLRNEWIADAAHARDAAAMLDQDLADRLARGIDLGRAGPFGSPLEGAPHQDTIYITVVDRDRMAVSLIYSIFRTFGSGLASPKFGILLHNRGSGFTTKAGHPNEAGPSKRPMHTIIPGMVRRDGAVAMPFGVMGGQYQANGHARLLTNLEDFGMDIQSAIDAPRSFAYDTEMRIERGYGADVASALEAKGHNVVVPDEAIGGAQAIQIDPSGVLLAGSDPRKDGCALGY